MHLSKDLFKIKILILDMDYLSSSTDIHRYMCGLGVLMKIT